MDPYKNPRLSFKTIPQLIDDWKATPKKERGENLAPFEMQMSGTFRNIENPFITITVNAKKAIKSFKRMGFTFWLWDQPKWQRPFMRFAWNIEERLGLHD